MSPPPPLLGVEEIGQSNIITVMPSSPSVKERNFIGLSDCSSSVDSSSAVVRSDDNRNLKATELRLGLPGSLSPERDVEVCLSKIDEKPLFPLLPLKDSNGNGKCVVSGNKRGFSDTMDGFSEVKGCVFTDKNWLFHSASVEGNNTNSVAQKVKDVNHNVLQDRVLPTNGNNMNPTGASNNGGSAAPAAKAQVVGWPPIKSFRKNTLATTLKNNDEVDGKPGPGALFVKVSMDGAPYLRKVDLRIYSTYQELSRALEKMFSCFTIGQCGSHGAPGREKLSESKLRDLLNGSEYVLTYEDKDGDWMLVGDVPWEMFIDTCKRLKIMKSSDAIGLAPRAMEKSKIKT